MSNAQMAKPRLPNTVQIVAVNPVRAGISQITQKPYEWHTVECILFDDAGNVSCVGELNVPAKLRETIGGMPAVGMYQAIISLVVDAADSKIKPQIINLVPIAGNGVLWPGAT